MIEDSENNQVGKDFKEPCIFHIAVYKQGFVSTGAKYNNSLISKNKRQIRHDFFFHNTTSFLRFDFFS